MNKISAPALEALKIVPTFHERVWGGQNLRATTANPVGEAWIVYEHNMIASGSDAGNTLGQVAARHGADFLGKRAMRRTGARFPLLIKLLDCGEWLSLQVHPNDEQAERLEGPGHFGKTEAWHVLKAEPEARLISGLRPGATRDALAQSIRDGSIIEMVSYLPVEQGDTILTRAGTVHALGPGLLVYEVQQTSDLTYRIFDWNRPQTSGRKLHIEQSIAVSDPKGMGQHRPVACDNEDGRQLLTSCEYFTLEMIQSALVPVYLDTQGETFHALTVLDGELDIEGTGWSEILGQYETVVIPAICGAYRIYPRGGFRALVAGVGDSERWMMGDEL